MGLALATWQGVEEAHYKIFTKLLGLTLGGLGSVVYFSTESFEARRKMVDDMIALALKGRHVKKQRAQWEGLKKPLKDANKNRNKLAHYGIDYDLINPRPGVGGDGYVFNLTAHTLRPSRWNEWARLRGRAKEHPGHNLGIDEVKEYVVEFRRLGHILEQFHADLPRPAGTTEQSARSD